MKILFVDPPFQRFMGFYRFYYPLGLAYMAAVLMKQGHLVQIYDAEHTRDANSLSWVQTSERYDEFLNALEDDSHPVWKEYRAILNDFNPDVVGISVLSVKFQSASKIARICKEFNMNIPVIAGADHPTVFPSETLKDPNIDFVVRGEGEVTILELIAQIEKGGELAAIPGVSYKEGNEIKHNIERILIDKLDDIPHPALEALMNFKTYRPQDLGAIMASRGCPFACTFCGVFNLWTRKVRYRSPESVLAEIKWLHENYGVNYISFRDASFTLRKDLVQALCEGIIQAGWDIQWECITRPDLLDNDLLTLMKKSGCVTIRIGIESGSEEILRHMRKEIDLDRVRAAARLLNQHNFYWSAYFLFGYPLETKNTIKQTLDFIKEINPPFVTLSRFAPIPHTEIFMELKNYGLISPDINWSMESNQRFSSSYVYRMSSPEFETAMKEVAEFVENHNLRNSQILGVRDGRLKN
jgi:anaerobic magnesium-protoporphyrin IX monomethyl ester cyclase